MGTITPPRHHHPREAPSPSETPAHSPPSGNCCQTLQSSFLADPGRGGDNRYTVTKNHLPLCHPIHLHPPIPPPQADVPTSTLPTSGSGMAAARHALRRLYTASVTLGGSMKERRSQSSRTQDTTDCTRVGMLAREA